MPTTTQPTQHPTSIRKTLTTALFVSLSAALALGQSQQLVVPVNAASAKNDCSLAVVSHLVTSQQQVCDGSLTQNMAQDMARRGHGFAQSEQGKESILALGPDYSEQDALRWFQQAAQRGSAPAQVNLAVMYINGWGTNGSGTNGWGTNGSIAPANSSTNYGLALHWLHAAADQHFARAYYNLGILFLEGKGVHQDYAEALQWFQKGADAGDASSQVNLGYLYDQGLGCSKNAKTAVAWYRKAADAGTPLAENNLADMYLRGEGVEKNTDEAFRLFQKAAEASVTGARIKLGYMYANGLGAPKDPAAAYAWVASASLAGDRRGEYLLPSLELLLTPQQISAAKQRAQELSAAHAQDFSAKVRLP